LSAAGCTRKKDLLVNASRMAAIGHFFLKYRKAGILTGVALDDPLLADIDAGSIEAGMPEDFARDLEALGPTFVKVGQALSTRPDFVPAPYVAALERMQDAVAVVDSQAMREIIRRHADRFCVFVAGVCSDIARRPPGRGESPASGCGHDDTR